MLTNVICAIVISRVIFWLLMFLRNSYTYKRQMDAMDIVNEYMQYMSNRLTKGELLKLLATWNDYTYDYDEYMFDLFLWGKYSAIKPQYKELLINKAYKKE
jgi:hypothetical protein